MSWTYFRNITHELGDTVYRLQSLSEKVKWALFNVHEYPLTSFCPGKYDILRKRAELLAPPRFKAIRDFLDPGMLEEAAFHILDYYSPTDSENPLCKNHSSMYQDAFLRDQPWAVGSKCADTFAEKIILKTFEKM